MSLYRPQARLGNRAEVPWGGPTAAELPPKSHGGAAPSEARSARSGAWRRTSQVPPRPIVRLNRGASFASALPCEGVGHRGALALSRSGRPPGRGGTCATRPCSRRGRAAHSSRERFAFDAWSGPSRRMLRILADGNVLRATTRGRVRSAVSGTRIQMLPSSGAALTAPAGLDYTRATTCCHIAQAMTGRSRRAARSTESRWRAESRRSRPVELRSNSQETGRRPVADGSEGGLR